MLDQAANPEEEGRALPKEEEHYTPKHAAEPLTSKLPSPNVKRFNRKMLALLLVVAVVVVTLAFAVGLQQPKLKAPEPVAITAKPPVPNEHVNALPTSYSAGVPELREPRAGDIGAVPEPSEATGMSAGQGAQRQVTPAQQYAEQSRLDYLKNVDRARSAGVAFANADGGGASADTSAAAAAAGMPALQERLLNLADRSSGAQPSTSGGTRMEDPNHQDEKAAFAKQERNSEFRLRATLQLPRSPYTLFAGTILPCVMTQGINSDLPGQIGCMISQNVYDSVTGKHLLIPQGTKAIGAYDSRISYGQERVLVVWTRLLRPDGSTLSLEGMPGIDLSGYAGLTGHVNNHYGRLLSGVVLGSILGAGAQVAVGANSQNPSFSQLAIQGAGQNINQAGQQITRKNLDLQPTIEVPPGGRLNIFATMDLILPPYTE